jgi:hypothetical protein
VLGSRPHQLDAFDGAEDGDRRSDHGLATEHRGSDQDDQRPHAQAAADAAVEVAQGQEGEHAAFAPVVGPEDEDRVFHAHHQDQRPDDERKNAQDGDRVFRGRQGGQTLPDRVQRARPDVAEHHAQRADPERDLRSGFHGCRCVLAHLFRRAGWKSRASSVWEDWAASKQFRPPH